MYITTAASISGCVFEIVMIIQLNVANPLSIERKLHYMKERGLVMDHELLWD